jgi:hypothetical protein
MLSSRVLHIYMCNKCICIIFIIFNLNINKYTDADTIYILITIYLIKFVK